MIRMERPKRERLRKTMETYEADAVAVPGSAEPLSAEQTRIRLQELREWGVDLSLVQSSLSRTPTERLNDMLSC
jgi:hypothetical protein